MIVDLDFARAARGMAHCDAAVVGADVVEYTQDPVGPTHRHQRNPEDLEGCDVTGSGKRSRTSPPSIGAENALPLQREPLG